MKCFLFKPEEGKLFAWDAEGCQEIEPLHDFITGWSCERSRVVGIGACIGRTDEGVNVEGSCIKSQFWFRVNNIRKSISNRGQCCIVSSLQKFVRYSI